MFGLKLFVYINEIFVVDKLVLNTNEYYIGCFKGIYYCYIEL